MNGSTGHDHSGGTGLGPKITPAGTAGMTSDGIAVRTASTTFTPRTITGSTGITVTNGDGVAGNPTLTLDAQVVDIAGLTPTDNGVVIGNGTNFVVETGATLLTSIGAQTLDTELTALAGLTSAADRVPYFTGSGTAALATFTSFGRSLVDDADASAAQTTLALVPGTNVQAYDAELAALAGLTSAADRVPYFTGSGTAALATFTSTGRDMVAAASVAAQQDLLNQGRVLIAEVSAAGGTIDFTGLTSTYDFYVLDFLDIVLSSDGAAIQFRVSVAASFISTGSYSFAHTDIDSGSGIIADDGQTAQTAITICGNVGNTNNRTAMGQLQMPNLAGTALVKPLMYDTCYISSSGNLFRRSGTGMYTADASAIDGVRILAGTGNITTGKARLYGLRAT